MGKAVVILAFTARQAIARKCPVGPKSVAHSLKLSLVVMTTLVRSQGLLGRRNSRAPPDALNGRYPSSSRMDEDQEWIRGINAPRTEVKLGQAFGDLAGLALGRFLLQGVDQVDGREEADLATVMRDGLNAQGRGGVGLAGSGATDQDHVLGAVHERATVQCPDSGLVDLAGGEVDA